MPIALGLCRGLIITIALAFAILPAASVQAQETAAELPSPLTPDAINSLVSRLSDQEVRSLLLEELGSRAAAQGEVQAKPKQTMVDSLTQTLSLALVNIVKSAADSPHHARTVVDALSQYFTALGTQGLLRLVLAMALALAVGFAVDRAYTHKVRGKIALPMPQVIDSTSDLLASVRTHFTKLLREAGGAILAFVAAIAILTLLLPERETRVAVTAAAWLVFFPRLAWIVLRFLLSPRVPEDRILVTDDWTARVLFRNLIGLSIVMGVFEILSRINSEISANMDAQEVGFWINALIFIWLIAVFIACRKGLRSIVQGRNEKVTKIEEWVVYAYPAYGVFVIGLTWFVGEIAETIGKGDVVREGGHFLGLFILLIAPLCDTLIRILVRLFVPPMTGSGALASAAFEEAWRSYIRIARVVVFSGIVLLLSQIWKVSLFGNHSGNAPVALSGLFAEALLIVLVGYVALEIANLVINRKLASINATELADETHEMDEGPMGGAPPTRLGTILPPIGFAVRVTIITLTALTALGHLGVNVTALLAGAGVIGLAVGFGAQKLVSDVISGMFFLVDDAFRLNEYISAGSVEGTVERIALRSMLLRRSDGAIHCIPYSEMAAVTNFGRDWGTMKQVFTVPFDTDIEKVRKIFRRIGEELAANPEFKDAFIQPFKYKGVSDVNDVGIVVRGKFMFKPGLAKQFMIRREIYKRVQAEFAAAGIEFARREVRVSVEQHGTDLTEDDAKSVALGAASSAAVQDAITAAQAKLAP